jgi:glycosyltransferase involved in cell wall biosynthesis
LSKNTNIKSIAIIWENQEIGGVASYLNFILRNRLFRDFNITIYTNIDNKAHSILKKKLEEFNNIKYVYFRSFLNFHSNLFIFKFLNYVARPFFFLIQYFLFKVIFLNKNFDLVIGLCGGYGTFRSEPAALLASKKMCIKTLIVCHNTQGSPKFQSFILKFIDRFLSKKIFSIISISKATRNSLIDETDLFKCNKNLKNSVIYLGIPVSQKVKKLPIKELEKKNRDIFNIGILSRIEEYKGHEDLLVAYASLPGETKEKFMIYLVGSCKQIYKKKLLRLLKNLSIENNVIFTGYLPEESQEIISNFDLLMCLTRDFEGFGITLAEAMSVKVPILATKVGAIPEFLNEKNSYLINPCSPSEISKALENFILNNNSWKLRAENAYNDFYNFYNSDVMCKKLITHFGINIK